MDYVSSLKNPTNNKYCVQSSDDGELVQCFDLKSVLIDIIQTHEEKLVDSYTTNRCIMLEESIDYMESSGRFSRDKLEPYIWKQQARSEITSTT